MAGDGNWMEKAFGKNKGGLHRATGTPTGKKIPTAKVRKAAKSGDSHVRHMAQAAKNASRSRGRKG